MYPGQLSVMAFADELRVGLTLVNVSAPSQLLRADGTLQSFSLEMLCSADIPTGCGLADCCPACRDTSGPVLSRLYLRSLQRPNSPEQRFTQLQPRHRF